MPLKKIVYFHENQLVYPVRENKERDFQYGYNQILTCLVADKIVFNSFYNQESFLGALKSFFKLMPDNRPKGLEERIRPKCSILPFPLILPSNVISGSSSFLNTEQSLSVIEKNTQISLEDETSKKKTVIDCAHEIESSRATNYICTDLSGSLLFNFKSSSYTKKISKSLHIVWPHRWEHDKDPDAFFSVIFQLKKEGISFQLSVLGESYNEKPAIFNIAQNELESHIVNWGFQKSKEDYYAILRMADVAVSTAKHEFFGVAMLEAASCGCYPLCPRKLVYPDVFSDEYLYDTKAQLLKQLRKFCLRPDLVRQHNIKVELSKYSWENLREQYLNLLQNES